MSTPPGDPERERVGPWELVARLGKGGMAEVWRARRAGSRGPDVALKRVLPVFAHEESFVRMFAVEARLSADLEHPNVVRVLDAGPGYLVMELVEGWTLTQLLAVLRLRREAVSPRAAVAIARPLAAALGYVHARGLVHRDLSPSNVVVQLDGGVKLLDFGIAKALDGVGDARTRTGALKGKVPYMSPEQAAGQPVDARSDQFSLGALLHELLTGRRLFEGAGELATLALVRAAEVDPPSMGAAGVPRALDEICLRLLARDPAERFPDLAAVERALDEAAGALGGAGAAESAALVERLQREEAAGATRSAKRTRSLHRGPVRGRRVARWIAPAVAVALTAAVLGGAVALRRARQAKPVVVEQKIEPAPAPAPVVTPSPSPPPPSRPTHRRRAPDPEEQLRRQIKKGRPVDPFAE